MPFLPGFEDRWTDATDFIHGVSKQIWEDRALDAIATYYRKTVISRTPSQIAQGLASRRATMQAVLAEFPDRSLLGEDVLWMQTGEDSFFSSLRQTCMATHTQSGLFGAPTGRKLTYRIFTDNWVKANQIEDEWQIHDSGAVVRQMGREIPEWVRALIAFEGGPALCTAPLTPEIDLAGPYQQHGNENEWGLIYADLLERVLNAELSVIADAYDRAAELFYPSHTYATGHAAADKFWLGLRSAFPSATIKIDHVIGREDPLSSPTAAVRFSLQGSHDGHGMFGQPTGAQVYVMGIAHAEFGPRGIRREWALIDETAIWKQILIQTGSF